MKRLVHVLSVACGAAVLFGCQSLSTGADTPPEDALNTSKTEQALDGTNAAGVNLAGANLAGANLAGTNLAGSNLAGTNLAGVNLAGANLGGANLAGTNLAGTNIAGVNVAGVNMAGKTLATTTLSGSTAAGAATAGASVTGTTLAGATLSTVNVGVNIHGLSGAQGMLYSGEDLYTRNASCAVMGIGSSAFGKLVGQNVSGTKMYAAIKLLPWKMNAPSSQLDAWEAVIWGSKTYCVFLISAPAGTTFAGVGGFIKAIFRWNASPAMSIDIGQIAGGQPINNYPGMMNAWNLITNGTLSPLNYMAGELSLITATTNNRTVSLDFSTWVRKTNQDPLIVGDISPNPIFAESIISTALMPDGTIGVFMNALYTWGGTSNMLEAAFYTWCPSKDGAACAAGTKPTVGAQPIPQRCAGALMLNSYYGVPMPPDQCDAVTTWSAGAPLEWTLLETHASNWGEYFLDGALNGYHATMPLDHPNDGVADYFIYRPSTGQKLPILAQTYIHSFVPPFLPFPSVNETTAGHATIATAQSLAFPSANLGAAQLVTGFLKAGTERDYYKINALPGQMFQVTLSSPGNLTYDISLYSASGAVLAPMSNHDGTSGYSQGYWINKSASAVTVYVAVSSNLLQSSTTGAYQLLLVNGM